MKIAKYAGAVAATALVLGIGTVNAAPASATDNIKIFGEQLRINYRPAVPMIGYTVTNFGPSTAAVGHAGRPDTALGRQNRRRTGRHRSGNKGAAIHPGAGQCRKDHAGAYSPAVSGDALHGAGQRRCVWYKPGGEVIEPQGWLPLPGGYWQGYY